MMKKHPYTLLEVMIVICLIALITGALGYSMKGTLDKGRAFQTTQAKEQLYDLLMLSVSEGNDLQDVAQQPEKYLKRTKLAKNPSKLVKDGWGQPFEIQIVRGQDLRIISQPLERYLRSTKGHNSGNLLEEDDDDSQ